MRLLRWVMLVVALGIWGVAGCAPIPQPDNRYPADRTLQDTTPVDGVPRAAGELLSAFFGLDNGLPRQSNLGLCRGAGNADGMPVIFAHEVDVRTLQAGDFRVVTAAGALGSVTCVTLFPAIDDGELRTALLVGEFGSATDDPPVRVEMVGHVWSADGTVDFYGAQMAVTPLAPGPTLILAETVPPAQWQTGRAGGPRGTGSGCPVGTTQVVRAVWAGGVTRGGSDGAEVDEAARLAYRVTLAQSDGSTREVAPLALADLGDGDNNHLLCLDVPGRPQRVTFPAGYLADPNGDLNPATEVAVQER